MAYGTARATCKASPSKHEEIAVFDAVFRIISALDVAGPIGFLHTPRGRGDTNLPRRSAQNWTRASQKINEHVGRYETQRLAQQF